MGIEVEIIASWGKICYLGFYECCHSLVISELACSFVIKRYCQFEIAPSKHLQFLGLKDVKNSLYVVALEVIDDRANEYENGCDNKQDRENNANYRASFTRYCTAYR